MFVSHTLNSDAGYLSWAAGDGDPVLAGDVTGAVVGGAGTRARCAIACRLYRSHTFRFKVFKMHWPRQIWR